MLWQNKPFFISIPCDDALHLKLVSKTSYIYPHQEQLNIYGAFINSYELIKYIRTLVSKPQRYLTTWLLLAFYVFTSVTALITSS